MAFRWLRVPLGKKSANLRSFVASLAVLTSRFAVFSSGFFAPKSPAKFLPEEYEIPKLVLQPNRGRISPCLQMGATAPATHKFGLPGVAAAGLAL